MFEQSALMKCEKQENGYLCLNLGRNHLPARGFLCLDQDGEYWGGIEQDKCNQLAIDEFKKRSSEFCAQGNNLHESKYYSGKGNNIFLDKSPRSLTEAYFADMDGKPIPPTEKITYCNIDHMNDFDEALRNEFWDKKEKAEQEQLQKISKKYGYKFCNGGGVDQYLARAEAIPKNCITQVPTALKVLQQTDDGTLATSPFLPAIYSDSNIVLVVNNKAISKIPDGGLFAGYFIGAGTYKYTNVLGAKRTIQKIKLLERQ
ncbi:MAG: hypothetical protein NC548_55330 [Lachnospiraceae bacterium]|nr:hypothetical protein [Lachnospiraceae bacterium]